MKHIFHKTNRFKNADKSDSKDYKTPHSKKVQYILNTMPKSLMTLSTVILLTIFTTFLISFIFLKYKIMIQ